MTGAVRRRRQRSAHLSSVLTPVSTSRARVSTSRLATVKALFQVQFRPLQNAAISLKIQYNPGKHVNFHLLKLSFGKLEIFTCKIGPDVFEWVCETSILCVKGERGAFDGRAFTENACAHAQAASPLHYRRRRLH